MNKDLEAFENRSDDWLAKERAYEDSISAWDLDEGKRIKENHERRHRYYEMTHSKGVIGSKDSQYQNIGVFFLKMFLPVVLFIFLMSIFMFLAERRIISGEEIVYAVPFDVG